MKHSFYILLLLLMVFSCKEEDYFDRETDEAANSSMWDYLESAPSHDYFMELVSTYQLDTLMDVNSPMTLFIPTDESLMQLDTTDLNMTIILSYLMVPTLVNVQSFTKANKVQTQSLKFALIEYNMMQGAYTYDGISIAESSYLYNDGRFYILEDLVLPAPNLYEYISQTSLVFKDFIDMQDSVYFDIDASTPIDFGVGGTVYDSVFSTVNRFQRDYFPVQEEFRNTTATFTLFTQEQYDAALDVMKADLETDIIPDVWQNEILLPTLVSNSIFNNSLQYTDFTERMVNINGDSVNVEVDNIDPTSRYICSNGVAFTLTDFIIPDSLYKAQGIINGHNLVTVENEGESWLWHPDVTIEAPNATSVYPKLTAASAALNGEMLDVDLAENAEDTVRFTFVMKGIFGAEKYRLLWAGSNTRCGLFKIYINGEPLSMRDEAGKDSDYFDSYMFIGYKGSGVIRAVTGLANFLGTSTYNTVDFKVENITEYSDVEITFEYLGPSLDSRGATRGSAGLMIDYLRLEMYD